MESMHSIELGTAPVRGCLASDEQAEGYGFKRQREDVSPHNKADGTVHVCFGISEKKKGNSNAGC